MAENKFSYKAAISHGWQMTKKYWKSILLLVIVYAGITLTSETMRALSGSPVTRENIREIYKDRGQGDRFYQYLKTNSYLSQTGHVEDKLQQINAPDDLVLTTEFEGDRARIYTVLNEHRYRLPFPMFVFILFSVVFWVIDMLVSIGCIKISIMLMRDQEPSVSDLFANWGFFIPYLLATICYGFAVFAGILLLIVPGIIVSVMLGMYTYLIVDKGLGPIESLKRSYAITNGSKWRLFVFGLVLTLFNLGGLLCFLVGVFVTMIISSIAVAYVYDCLDKSSDAVVV